MQNSIQESNRTITVEGDFLPRLIDGSSALKLRRITGAETLSQPYEYHLELSTSLDMPDEQAANLDLRAMLCHEMTVKIQLDGVSISISGMGEQKNIGEGIREISGLVTEASLVEKKDRYYIYRLVISPWIVLAKRRTDYRIFQKKTIIEIIDELLNGQYSYFYELHFQNVHPIIEYEVQYGESDYDFLQRLLERSGIYWYFKHEHGMHRMILTDSMGTHAPVASSAYQVLPYSPSEDRNAQEFISSFNMTECIQSGGWTTNDFDFTKPLAELTVENSDPKPNPYNNLAIYEWPGNYTDTAQGNEYARVRMEEIQVKSLQASGKGNVRNIVCGTTFNLQGYPQKNANREYLVTHSWLEAEELGEASASGNYNFKARFNVQPVTIPFRPERKTKLPRTTGPQTAIVTGPPGQEIWTDEHGRVKVKFHWDRSSMCDHNSSCWIRVSYPWAGSNFGGVNIPRVGTEVIVDFKNGDPNRPIITGRVYNNVTMPPWDLPGNATQSGLISRSLGGGLDNANALRFEDRMGQEEVWLQAERDLLTQVKNHEVHQVQANRNKAIGGDETTDIQGTRSETVVGDEKIELMANRRRSVAKDETIEIGGNHQKSVKGNQRYDVTNNHDRSIGGDDSLDVSGQQNIKINKGQKVEVEQDLNKSIGGDHTVSVGKTYNLTATDKIELIVGSVSFVLESNGNITINGVDINIGGSGHININGDTVDLN
ncbi:type VI secretion system Vgr family protein [Serratia sp. UGAL515B_01]|uniref:type VI secretion system Vgr family protein n=1 Tax=Serratia sp. UGAL515B_01 TaxID=2986763 RepID=UPI0029548611|nr:type VI secretion system tip protein TssI/VgrG [Serratia sp. UGAL515B_01]WON76730.1 type VI secretion system tip protein VgrG [Serratia sp. UGAL515B_01]